MTLAPGRRRIAGGSGPAVVAVASVAAVVALATGLPACTHDGRTLRAPPPGATAPPLPTTKGTTSPSVAVATNGLVLQSPDLGPDGILPVVSTCDGADRSPALSWRGVPAGTAELALTVVDLDAGGFVHWVVAGIGPAVGGSAAGTPPAGSVQATDDRGRIGYAGPCPPAGSGVHRYVFTLWALARPSGLTEGMSGRDALAQIDRAPLTGRTAFTGTYQRP